MLWAEVRARYPNQWLLIEALEAHTTPDRQRHLDRITVIELCEDGRAALERYRKYHQLNPEREYYFVHTSREALDIREQQWVGIRLPHAA